MEKCRECCLEIYALNDVHGRFFNTPHYDTENTGSLANASTFLKGLEHESEMGMGPLSTCSPPLQCRDGPEKLSDWPKVTQQAGTGCLLAWSWHTF